MIDNILKILLVNGAILIIPGLNFYLISNISMNRGIKFGLIAAFGVTSGIMLHVFFSIIGAYKIFSEYPYIFQAIKTIGVVYIIWLAYKLIKQPIYSYFTKRRNQENFVINYNAPLGNSLKITFFNGFCVDLFNPYITLFYFSLFSHIMNENTSSSFLSIYAVTIFLLTIFWFGLVAVIFSRKMIQNLFQCYKNLIEIISGIFLLYFAAMLYLS